MYEERYKPQSPKPLHAACPHSHLHMTVAFSRDPPPVQSLSLKGIRSPHIQTADVDASISPWWCPNPALTNSLQDSQTSWWNISEQEEGKKKKKKILFNWSYEVYSPIGFSSPEIKINQKEKTG